MNAYEIGRGTTDRRPNVTGIVTTLMWNAAIAIGLGAWVLIASLSKPTPSAGEDWSGVILVILLMVGAIVLAVGTGMGAAVTGILVRWRLRRTRAAGHLGMTKRTAVLLGSAGAGIGWLV